LKVNTRNIQMTSTLKAALYVDIYLQCQ